MATETLIFMPNGDVTLTLIRYVMKEEDNPSNNASNTSNTVAPKQTSIDEDKKLEDGGGVEAEEADEAEEDDVLFFAPDAPGSENGPTHPPPPRARRGSNASSQRERSESPPASFWATLKRQRHRLSEVSDVEQPVTLPTPAKISEPIVLSSHEVHCVVSSRHMMLASGYFQTLLSGDFDEAVTLRTKGHVTIPLLDDLDTMIILLHIIHGAGRKVPRQISLEVLSKLAVLVSKFEMLETVEFFSDTWIDNIQREGLPKSYNENVLPLVFVFWVFDRPSEFKDMTRLTQRECNEKLDEDAQNIPILHSIIDAIKRDREFAIETAITVVHALIDRYMAGQTICDSALDDELRYACDAMVLGCLMTSCRKIGIWPKPEAPFNGRKFKDLVHSIRSIRILDVCNKTNSRRWNSHGPSPNCHGLEDSIEASMKSIEAGLDGLKLSDYPRKSEDYNSIFQTSLLAPLKDEVKEHTKENTTWDFQVYVSEKAEEAPKISVMADEREFSVLESGFSTRIESRKMEESAKEQEQTKTAPTESLRASLKSEAPVPVREVNEPSQDGVKVVPRPHSRDFQQQEARASPNFGVNIKDSEELIKEEAVKTTPRDSASQESRILAKASAKIADEPPPKAEVKPELRKVASTDEKNAQVTTSPPVQVVPVVKPPPLTVEIRESGNNNNNPSSLSTTEAEDTWTPPKGFRMKKSKKTFSTRY